MEEKEFWYIFERNPVIAMEKVLAENARLKEEIKEFKKYQYEQEYLDKEIEEMQKALKVLVEGLNKRQILLQEIKEIAEFHTTEADSEDVQEDMKHILQKIAQASRVRSVEIGLREQDEQDTEARLMRAQQDAEYEVSE